MYVWWRNWYTGKRWRGFGCKTCLRWVFDGNGQGLEVHASSLMSWMKSFLGGLRLCCASEPLCLHAEHDFRCLLWTFLCFFMLYSLFSSHCACFLHAPVRGCVRNTRPCSRSAYKQGKEPFFVTLVPNAPFSPPFHILAHTHIYQSVSNSHILGVYLCPKCPGTCGKTRLRVIDRLFNNDEPSTLRGGAAATL